MAFLQNQCWELEELEGPHVRNTKTEHETRNPKSVSPRKGADKGKLLVEGQVQAAAF